MFARIVQLLLEPEAPTSTHEDSEEEIEGLSVLDRVCRSAAGLAPRSVVPSPSAVKEAVGPLALAIDVALEAFFDPRTPIHLVCPTKHAAVR